MVAHSRRSRGGGSRPDGQHFLRSRLVAAELVRDAAVGPTDHVLEIGAGTGRLTHPLADVAGRVTAVEIDARLVRRLQRSFESQPHVQIVGGDIMRTPLPTGQWRAFGNIPFAFSTQILRRLLGAETVGLDRADVLIQYEAARKRAAIHPGTLLSLSWRPWWQLTLTRRIQRAGFEPPPAVDAGMLAITRRRSPLLDLQERRAYVALLSRAFDKGSWPVRRSLHAVVPPMTWKRLARDRGLGMDARPGELDVQDWVAIHRTVHGRA